MLQKTLEKMLVADDCRVLWVMSIAIDTYRPGLLDVLTRLNPSQVPLLSQIHHSYTASFRFLALVYAFRRQPGCTFVQNSRFRWRIQVACLCPKIRTIRPHLLRWSVQAQATNIQIGAWRRSDLLDLEGKVLLLSARKFRRSSIIISVKSHATGSCVTTDNTSLWRNRTTRHLSRVKISPFVMFMETLQVGDMTLEWRQHLLMQDVPINHIHLAPFIFILFAIKLGCRPTALHRDGSLFPAKPHPS